MKYTDSFKTGDIIVCDRFFYTHNGIYVGKGRVIHYVTKNGDFGVDVKVRETSLENLPVMENVHSCPPLKAVPGQTSFIRQKRSVKKHSLM